MEQFIVIVAVILYMIFRGAAGQQRREREPTAPDSTLPGPRPGRDAAEALEDQQRRALEALQRWEERQRRGSSRAAEGRRRVARDRDEAFAAIAGMLEPAVLAGERPDAVAPPAEEPEPSRQRLRKPTRTVTRASDRGGKPAWGTRAADRADDWARPRRRGSKAPLARLGRYPPTRRAVVYAELFGPPVAFRDPG